MQIRKPDIESAILKMAELEFYRYGYVNASLRRIINASGTSIGNFYNYFESKEALYDALVKDEYERFIAFIKQHNSDDEAALSSGTSFSRADWKNNLNEIYEKLVPELVSRMIPDFNIRFVIMIEGSKGTKYENASSTLIQVISDHFSEHARAEGIAISEEFNRLLSEQFLTGIIKIIRIHRRNKTKRNKLLTEYILFFFTGAMSIFRG